MDARSIKKRLREEALARRDALDPQWRIEMAIRLAEAVQAIAAGVGDVVSGFWPMRSEVDIRPLMSALRDRGARIALPAIVDRTTIVFRELLPGAPMVEMGFGTYGPDASAEVLDPSLMLVPLAAFDTRGHRIGYGAGYYDRAVAELCRRRRQPRLVGIAFDCQQVEAVPDQPHDVALDALLSESGLRAFPLSR